MSVADVYRERLSVWSDVVEHLAFMHDLVVDIAAQVVVELGVRSGNSTAALLAAVIETEGRLWSVDVEQCIMPECFDASGRWTFVLGDDLQVVDQLPEDIDVLFVDSSHHYNHTLSELVLYGPRSKVILLHDTELEHPWMAPSWDPPFPVKAAIGDYCAASGRTWENRPNCYGLGIIR